MTWARYSSIWWSSVGLSWSGSGMSSLACPSAGVREDQVPQKLAVAAGPGRRRIEEVAHGAPLHGEAARRDQREALEGVAAPHGKLRGDPPPKGVPHQVHAVQPQGVDEVHVVKDHVLHGVDGLQALRCLGEARVRGHGQLDVLREGIVEGLEAAGNAEHVAEDAVQVQHGRPGPRAKAGDEAPADVDGLVGCRHWRAPSPPAPRLRRPWLRAPWA